MRKDAGATISDLPSASRMMAGVDAPLNASGRTTFQRDLPSF